MKKAIASILVMLILLAACVPKAPVGEMPPPFPMDEVTPPPESMEPEPLTIELAAELYSRFLEGEIASAEGVWLSMYYDLGMTKDMFMVRDLTGDGIPEIYHQAPHPIASVWGIENGQIIYIEDLGTYHSLLANGGIFYHRPGGAPTHDDYRYCALSPESKAFPDVSFGIYYADEAQNWEEICTLNGEEVTREEWQAVADLYFALRDAEPDEMQRAVSFSEWVASLDVSIEPLPLSVTKASRIYLTFFQHATYGLYSEYDLKGVTQFLIWDFTGDGIPEVYLPIYSRDVWTIRGTDVVLLGTLDDMDTAPEYPISFLEWCDGTVVFEPSPTEIIPSSNPIHYPDVDDLEYADLFGMEFWFSSGAGAWRTTLEIMPDGTFHGYFSDANMGEMYECYFSGQFSPLEKTGDYEYSMKCETLVAEGVEGEERIENGLKIITSTPYGFDDADEFKLYLPGKKTSELSEAFLSWADNGPEDVLITYGLYNVGGEQGFRLPHSRYWGTDEWVGTYAFNEADMEYSISIYKENEEYFADVELSGQTAIAKAYGSNERISLVLYEVLADSTGVFGDKIGGRMISFRKEFDAETFSMRDSFYTYWGTIQPRLPENEESNRVYFSKQD